jgi:hypothetical protein
VSQHSILKATNRVRTSDGLLGAATRGAIRDIIDLGWKGAAFAAFGDMVAAAFFPAPDPFRGPDGVKLGDSTLNRFLLLGEQSDHVLEMNHSECLWLRRPTSLHVAHFHSASRGRG